MDAQSGATAQPGIGEPSTASARGEHGTDKVPAPFEELTSKLKTYASFWETRKAIVRGEYLFDYTSSQLKAKKLMSPLTFNATQSAISALAAVMLGKVIGFFYPTPGHEAVALSPSADKLARMSAVAEPVRDKIADWLTTGVAPFTLLVVATMIGWASLYNCDHCREKRIRARNAYLYFDAAYGFFPQMLLALSSVALTTSWHVAMEKSGNVPAAFWMVSLVVFLIAALWQARITNVSVVSKLFAANGYSPNRRTLFNLRTKIENRGPWELYRVVAFTGVGVLSGLMFAGIRLVSYGLALGLAAIKVAVS